MGLLGGRDEIISIWNIIFISICNDGMCIDNRSKQMTRGKEVQDFIKEQKKSARERFEEAGWELITSQRFGYNPEYIEYIKDQNLVSFNLKNKTYFSNTFIMCIETHKLITYQLQELRWL